MWHKASKVSISISHEAEKGVYKHTDTTDVYLTGGYIQTNPMRDGCNHINTSPRRAQSIAKLRSRKANMEIKHRRMQANIDI